MEHFDAPETAPEADTHPGRLRIVRIVGRGEEGRRRRLMEVQAWMGAAGWRLTDYAETERSAMFERSSEAGALPFWHATRWLPAPWSWRPKAVFRALHAEPRLSALPAVVLAVAWLIYIGTVGSLPSLLDSPLREAARRAATEQEDAWLFVTSSALNVREAPSGEARIVGVLYRGQRVLIAAEEDGWARLEKPERGYVSRRFLAADAPP